MHDCMQGLVEYERVRVEDTPALLSLNENSSKKVIVILGQTDEAGANLSHDPRRYDGVLRAVQHAPRISVLCARRAHDA